jgi:hypothetical protein
MLRAHPLLDGGVIAGPLFGRRLAHASVEAQRWPGKVRALPIGVALFTDLARADKRLPQAGGDPMQIDAGAGVRIKLPAVEGVLRVDYARGIRDQRQALTVGWQP